MSSRSRFVAGLMVLLGGSIVLNVVLGAMLLLRPSARASIDPVTAPKKEDIATVDHLLLQVQCGKGDTAACDKVQRIDDDGCAQGDGQACTLVAIGYETGRQRPKDEEKAARMYVKACDLGDPSGCWYAGARYEQGRGVAKDPDRALALFTKACDGKEVNGCLDLGSAHARAKPPQMEKALAAWDRACQLGYASACDRAKEARQRAK